MRRSEFEMLIREPIRAVADALDMVVSKAGLQPAVNDLLTERFEGRVVDHDPFTSVAAGLAIANFRQLRYTA